MRKNRSAEIIDFLKVNRGMAFSAEELSARFGISQRQIRNYINQINQEGEIIRQSEGRYSFSKEQLPEQKSIASDCNERVAFILSRLLSDNEIDLYEIAEELCVSEATVQGDLKKLRRRIEPFRLTLINHNSCLSLEGTEKNKRSLVSYMITNTHYRGFMFDDGNRFLDNDYQIDILKKNLIEIFNDCSFYYNDYSLNNIILHLIITIDRLCSNYSIEETQMTLQISDIEKEAAQRIAVFLEEQYEVKINSTEFNNIAAFLTSNLATLDYRMIDRQNISSYISQSTIELVDEILERVTDYYLLDPFDDVFFARFCLHIDNLLKRVKIDHSVRNPMLRDIKLTYPLIFDIAVYIAELIGKKTGYRISQDEISLIALHVGSFIESNDLNKNKISAIYVYSDYHQFYQHNITRIQSRFEKDLNLLYTVSASDYDSLAMKSDLLISETEMPEAVRVSPFITDRQIDNIEAMIKVRSKEKETDQFFDSVESLFRKDLFFTDIYAEDEYGVIRKLMDRLKEKGLFGEDFVESVISREKMSSTCFIKKVAIPHAIGQTIPHSFISVVTYEHPQKWGNEEIQLLILFGISYAERKDFRFVFNHIVSVLGDEANINALSRCRSHEEMMELARDIID